MAQGAERPDIARDPDVTLGTTTTPSPGPEDAAALKARIAVLEQGLATAQADAAAARAAAEELEAGKAAGTPAVAKTGRHGRWRPWVVAVLLILAIPLAISTVVARWAHNEIGNTDRYVATVAPLASNPAIQQEMVDKVTTAIFSRFDVQAVTTEAIDALTGQGLPPRAAATLNALTVPLVSGIQSFVRDQVTKLVESDTFQNAWVVANEQAHTQLVAVLTGEGTDAVSVSGGTVSLNLSAIINTVKTQLVASGFDLAQRIPTVNASFTILESADLAKAQSAFSVLSTMAVVLPFLLLLVLGLAIGLARDRRRTLIIAALTVAGSMLVIGVTLNLARPFYLNHVPPDVLSTPAAAALFDALVHFLRLALRIVVVVMLAIVLVAWLVGPSRSATTLRGFAVTGARALGSTTSKAGGAAIEGVNTGAVGVFARAHLIPLRIGVGGVAILLFAVADHPGAGYVITLIVLAVLGWLLVEFLARTAPPTEAAPTVASPSVAGAASGG